MLNKEQNAEECDATGFNSSNAVGFIKNLFYIFIPVKHSLTFCKSKIGRPLEEMNYSFKRAST